MRIFLVFFWTLLAILSAAPATAQAAGPGACTPWTQVNDDAFGMDTGADGSYANEEGFEVVVFRDQLYFGMEADNSYGARLWRTRAGIIAPAGQADWEEVIADAAGRPFGYPNITQNDHVDSLAVFASHLYVSTANGGSSTFGTQVWRSPSGDPGTWLQVNTDGFGDVHNTNFKDMQVFDGWLCGGTWNEATGAQVWCTADGTSWVRKNTDGFGRRDVITIWSGAVYNGALYFGALDRGPGPTEHDDVARLYRTHSLNGLPTWEEVYAGQPGSRRVDLLGALAGYLYIATSSPQGIVILRSANGDPGTWQQVNIAGMGPQRAANFGAVVDGATVYNGALYVAVTNLSTGVEVWRTAGLAPGDNAEVDWTLVGGSGLGEPNNSHAELIVFNGDLYAWTSNYRTGQQARRTHCPAAAHVILLIGDGMGANHLAAANLYTGSAPAYQTWSQTWISTFPADGDYDPNQAWSDFAYVKTGATDSAAAATALYTGQKTANGRLSATTEGARLFNLADKARALGRAVGAVTSVYLSHATPGAWYAHNLSRVNGYAIADEGLWGDPNTTGTSAISPYYSGGLGPTYPPADVIIGAGHPAWRGGNYVNWAIRNKLIAKSDATNGFTFVERIAGSPHGGARLLAAASDPAATRLVGLFGGTGGNLEYRQVDGHGTNPENPTLAEMAQAALAVLSRNPAGFVLLVEGGAIDWAAHNNNLDQVVGEVLAFNAAVQAVSNWVDDPATPADWSNTLVIVTADHETSYLTAGPGLFPNQPLGPVNAQTLQMEKVVASTGRRASWHDMDGDGEIDAGEKVYWAWNSNGHTNSLVPVYVRGAGAELVVNAVLSVEAGMTRNRLPAGVTTEVVTTKGKGMGTTEGVATKGEGVVTTKVVATKGEGVVTTKVVTTKGKGMGTTEGVATKGEGVVTTKVVTTKGEGMGTTEGVATKGEGKGTTEGVATKGRDPVRGIYLDNTDIFRLMEAVTLRVPEPLPPDPPAAPRVSIFLDNDNNDAILTWPAVPGALIYEVWQGDDPLLNPGDPGASVAVIPAPAGAQVYYIDFDAAKDPLKNRYYAVRTVGPGGKSAIGLRVNLFQACAGSRIYLPAVWR